MSHTYDVGTKAWQPDATEGWVASEVVDKKVQGEKVMLVFALENGEVCLALCKTMLAARDRDIYTIRAVHDG